jgi:NADPH-dependent 7-cyano-7-deazaguanine reductase QueF
VTGISEAVNVKVRYIPNEKVIDICSYREYFEKWKSNLAIEDIADVIFHEIKDSANPKALEVEVYLDDIRLTPWSVLVSE